MAPLTIDIVSDAVCPWCYLGKRRLEAALQEIGAGDAVVRWRPFQLDESVPVGGLDRQTYMNGKFPNRAQLDAAHARLTSMGAEVGANFDFDAISRAPNTLDAHRLIRWAAEAGLQDAVVERLFKAYFEQGLDIGDADVLARLGGESGLDGKALREKLASDEDRGATEEEIAHWRRAGVSGVPFFIFDGRLAVSGAQATETFVAAIKQAREGG